MSFNFTQFSLKDFITDVQRIVNDKISNYIYKLTYLHITQETK